MVTTAPLTSRDDLVESLDADAIFDYLIQHGVLNESQREGLLKEEGRKERNHALLGYIEGTGNAGVGLLINALRQSGQLHLASSLDVTSRIKPTYGSGYLGKERHKGQVTIRVEVGSIYAIYPKWEDEKYPEEEEVLPSTDVILTPRRAHKSYENMTLIGEPASSSRSRKIQDYNYESDEEIRTTCWCFCRHRRTKKVRQRVSNEKGTRRKLDYEVKPHVRNHKSEKLLPDNSKKSTLQNGSSNPGHLKSIPPRELTLVKSETPQYKGSMTSLKNGKFDTPRVLYSKGELSEAKLKSELREIYRNSLNSLNIRLGSSDSLNLKNNVNSVQSSTYSLEEKENLPPDKFILQTSRIKETKSTQNSVNDMSAPESKESVETCLMWKSRGPTFESYVEKFCDSLEDDVNVDIVKYFEQERGILVLSLSVESCLMVCTICMTNQQIQHITEDIENGELLKVLNSLILSQDVKDAMCVSDVKLNVVVDQEEVTLALQELS